jgi:hypothetical protein
VDLQELGQGASVHCLHNKIVDVCIAMDAHTSQVSMSQWISIDINGLIGPGIQILQKRPLNGNLTYWKMDEKNIYTWCINNPLFLGLKMNYNVFPGYVSNYRVFSKKQCFLQTPCFLICQSLSSRK